MELHQPKLGGACLPPDEQTLARNYRVMELLSRYLNDTPSFINADMVRALTDGGMPENEAFTLLLAAAVGLDVGENREDTAFYHAYFPSMCRQMDAATYRQNPYYRNIRFPQAHLGDCDMTFLSYAPYEAFVSDDTLRMPDGRQIPQIGYFNEPFDYPAILENGRLWMAVTPNEVNTMAEDVQDAFGRVLAFGLGLGYLPYMVSLSERVESVTVVEQNERVIRLFTQHILPQFPHRETIRIVQGDAYAFAKSELPNRRFDYIYTDLWHDAGDGIPMYLRMKQLEPLCPDAVYRYWIEKTMLCYLESV